LMSHHWLMSQRWLEPLGHCWRLFRNQLLVLILNHSQHKA
jgi:hypothetical protein